MPLFSYLPGRSLRASLAERTWGEGRSSKATHRIRFKPGGLESRASQIQ
jgi:hypothetical protein